MLSAYTTFLSLSVFSLMLLSISADRQVVVKYKWHESDEVAGDVTVDWVRDGACKLSDTWDGYNVEAACSDPKTHHHALRGDTITKDKPTWGYKKTTHMSCDALNHVSWTIHHVSDPNLFFKIRVVNICCDASCSKSKKPDVHCDAGPKGAVLTWGPHTIDECGPKDK